MLAGTYTMFCEQGTTFVRILEIQYPDPADPTGETYLPFDLSGYTGRMQVRRTMDSPTTMLNLSDTVVNGSQVEMRPAGDNNSIRIYISDEATATLETSGVYDLEIENSGGEVSRVLQGDFVVSPQVTR